MADEGATTLGEYIRARVKEMEQAEGKEIGPKDLAGRITRRPCLAWRLGYDGREATNVLADRAGVTHWTTGQGADRLAHTEQRFTVPLAWCEVLTADLDAAAARRWRAGFWWHLGLVDPELSREEYGCAYEPAPIEQSRRRRRPAEPISA